MKAASLQRPLLHWRHPVPFSRFRASPLSSFSFSVSPYSSSCCARVSCKASYTNGLLQFRGRFVSLPPLLLGTNWLRRSGFRTSVQQPFNFQVLNGVRRGGPQTGVQERRSSKPVRRMHTKAPPPNSESPAEMGKREKPTGPKKLSLRNTSSHANSTISFVQILGTGMDTGDTAPCVLLFFDQRRFIFNAGEGLQRFCIEHKIKLSKIDHVFLTRVGSETAGGLPGLLLTLAGIGDVGMAVNIWGPSDLQYLVDAMRTFVPNASIVHTHSFGEASPRASPGAAERSAQVLLEDDVVKITAVLLRPQMLEGNGASGARAKKGLKRPRVEQSDTEPSVADDGGDLSVVYVCELPEVKGRFDLKKAQTFFSRPGPHYGMLQAGKSVMSSDGVTMVHPSDVMGPSSPGPIFILVDCPTAAYIPALLTNPELCSLQDNMFESSPKQVTLIVHVSPASVTQTPQYQAWMSRFGGAQHVMAGHGMLNMSQPILKSSARVVSRLNLICPQVFSVSSLQPNLLPTDTNTEGDSKLEKEAGSELVTFAENLLKFRLRPLATLGLDRSSVPAPFSIAEVQEQVVLDIPELRDASQKIAELWKNNSVEPSDAVKDGTVVPTVAERETETERYYVEEPWLAECTPIPSTMSEAVEPLEARHSLGSHLDLNTCDDHSEEEVPACLQGVGREEMEMVFLGTGSSQPSKYRNVSAIYVHLFDRGGIILDCGEGTYAQLKRRYGSDGADEVLAGLECVWISHIHADHHTGLARILSVRKAILERRGRFTPVLVVGPKQLKRFLDAYGQLEDLGMEFLDCSQTTADADGIAAMELDPFEEMGFAGGSRPGSPPTARVASPGREAVAAATSTGIGLVRKASLGGGGGGGGPASPPKKGQMRNFWLLPGANLQAGIDWAGRAKLRRALSALGLARLTSVPVVHCAHAFGVVLEAEACAERPGWKVVYSGDTRPCDALVEASRGATVLIHEATFDDGMPEEAQAKKHSLTREAIETGVSAGVYRTILTHFSQRYPKIPVFDDSYTSRTCIAFDMMSANLADLRLLPSLLPALKLLFKDELMAIEEDGGADDAEPLSEAL